MCLPGIIVYHSEFVCSPHHPQYLPSVDTPRSPAPHLTALSYTPPYFDTPGNFPHTGPRLGVPSCPVFLAFSWLSLWDSLTVRNTVREGGRLPKSLAWKPGPVSI